MWKTYSTPTNGTIFAVHLDKVVSFLSLRTPLASLLYFEARGLLSERQSETLRCPRAHFPNSQIINWKSRGNVIQFFSSLNCLHISSSQEAQRLGHFKAQPCALVRQLARRRISFSCLTFAVKGGVCIVRPWNRFIKSIQAAWCGLNASLPDSVGL